MKFSENAMKLRPLQDRIVVQRLESESTTAGGIIIPDTAKEKPVTGKVVAVGNGKLLKDGSLRELEVSVGDTVMFGKYSGKFGKYGGKDKCEGKYGGKDKGKWSKSKGNTK